MILAFFVGNVPLTVPFSSQKGIPLAASMANTLIKGGRYSLSAAKVVGASRTIFRRIDR